MSDVPVRTRRGQEGLDVVWPAYGGGVCGVGCSGRLTHCPCVSGDLEYDEGSRDLGGIRAHGAAGGRAQ